MNILAIETSTRRASIAVAIAGRAVETIEMPEGLQTAAWLNQAVDTALRQSGLDSKEIELLGTTTGPGSFTGLRIAVTFAKLYCYSTAADLVALDTLEVVAQRVAKTAKAQSPLHIVMDAMRQELFHAKFQIDSDGHVQRETATSIVKQAEFLQQLESMCIVAGPAALSLRSALPDFVTLSDDALAFPNAAAVAELALDKYRQGQRDDIWELVPRYYRKSYAEERTEY